MKVLYDNQIFQLQKFGGISRYFNELMKIESNGIEVDTSNYNVDKNTNLYNQTLYGRGVRYLKRKLNIDTKQKTASVNNTDPFLNKNFDLFHPTYYDPYFLKFLKKPFVLTVYDMIDEIFAENIVPTNNPLSYYKRLLCEKADAILSISEKTKNDIIDIYKLSPDKVHAIPLASDFQNVQSQKPKGAEDLKNYILFVGKREGYKNFYFSAIALADILKADSSLTLLCTGFEFSNEEINFFKSHNIDQSVKHIYLANDRELAWVYENAQLFIFPSLYEGFGLPLLEAFAKDCPVISSTGGSLPEVGGDAVIYFEPKNILQIQDAAHKALYNNETRNMLIANGQRQLKNFSWDVCRSKTLEVYQSVIN